MAHLRKARFIIFYHHLPPIVWWFGLIWALDTEYTQPHFANFSSPQGDSNLGEENRLNLVDTFELSLDFRAVTTRGAPEPSGRPWADLCLWNCHHPKMDSPARDPVTSRAKQRKRSVRRSVAASFGCMAIAVRWSPSSSSAACRDFVGSTLWSAASLKKPCLNDLCIRTLEPSSPEDCWSKNVSLWALGKSAVIEAFVKKLKCI